MTDDPIDERLADLETEEAAEPPPVGEGSSVDSSEPSTSISVWTRFWAASTLVAHVGVSLSIAPGTGEFPADRSVLLASLVGSVVVAEVLLRWFGPGLTSALWDGTVTAILVVMGTVLLWTIATGSSPPDGVSGLGFLVVSAVVTVHRFDRPGLG
ncbi:hypothetical protein [Natrinema ejinorense]|uniref:Uncharacterized protein n=1 Tax=Natrinema ejinorense TaxID=373386 RepID=A0A2A5QYC7_9EURY|nr:hypothetical protein [Natrinema ejinorense]PCR91858.1 hypothetical protein CP557_15815 [Natrinema ejinorense]